MLRPHFHGVHYETIHPHETAEIAIERLKINARDWVVLPTVKLSGSQKILPLRSSRYPDAIAKIEGPGFVIDKIHFLLTRTQ